MLSITTITEFLTKQTRGECLRREIPFLGLCPLVLEVSLKSPQHATTLLA